MLKTMNIHKSYRHIQALNDISIHIEPGSIYGILGPNGSGKTTLMKIIAGILLDYKGCVLFQEKPISFHAKANIAFLPEENHLYEWMAVKDSKDFYRNHFVDFDSDKFNALCEKAKINQQTKTTDLSKGKLQQMRLILVLSRKASVYLLDEPLNGIDIITRDNIITLIRSNIREDCCMLLTSHLVNEIEQLLDQVHFIKNGCSVLIDSADGARMKYGKSIENIYREVMPND